MSHDQGVKNSEKSELSRLREIPIRRLRFYTCDDAPVVGKSIFQVLARLVNQSGCCWLNSSATKSNAGRESGSLRVAATLLVSTSVASTVAAAVWDPATVAAAIT